MGSLRTLFAIAVVFAHSIGYVFVGGRNAVQLFYMISGFLISYVLVERKAYPKLRDFYINRYLRLYPIYLFVALLTLLLFAIFFVVGEEVVFFRVYADSPYSANLLLVFSNVTLFLQDWVMFAGIKGNHLVFADNFKDSEVVLYLGLLVPQAWTLGVELTFYLLAPFIIGKRRILLTLLALSVMLRIYFVHIGLGTKDPWTYRFFPTELAFFLLGALSHQELRPIYARMLSKQQLKTYAGAATYGLIAITVVFSFIPVEEIYKIAVFFTLFLVLMPLTFIFQSQDRTWDKWIGDLSYPIYIGHMFVYHVATFAMKRMVVADKLLIFGKVITLNKLLTGLVTVLLSICFAVVLEKFIGAPVESMRNRFRRTAVSSSVVSAETSKEVIIQT